MEGLAKDETYCIETDCEIIEFTPGGINRDTRPEMPGDEVEIWRGVPWLQTVLVITRCYLSLECRHFGVKRDTGVVANPEGTDQWNP